MAKTPGILQPVTANGSCRGAVSYDISLRDGVEIYFVANGGTLTAAQQIFAKDPGSQSTCLSPDQVQNLTLNPGDIVMVDGRHGTITQEMNSPRGGTAAAPIRILGAKAFAPKLEVAGTDRCIQSAGHDHVHIGFFPDCSNTDGTFAAPINFFGPSVGCRWDSITVTRNRNDAGTASKDCFSVNSNLGSPAHVVARNLGFKGTQGGSSSVQGLVCKNSSTCDVYGWSATDQNLLMTANGGGDSNTRLRVFDGWADDAGAAMGNAVASGNLEIHRSHLIVKMEGPTASETGSVKLVDCDINMNFAGNTALAGILQFERCRLVMTGGGRYQIQNPDAIFGMKGCLFYPGNVNFWAVTANGGGSLQIEDTMIDCANLAGSGVFQIDAEGATAGHYFTNVAVKNFSGDFVNVRDTSGEAVPFKNCTAWNSTQQGIFVDNDRTDSGASVSIVNCGFENVANPSNSEANTAMNYNGFFNSPSQGSNVTLGDPLLVNPPADDFRNGSGSAWDGSGQGGADLGVNRAFSY